MYLSPMKLYKHENCRDVAIMPVKTHYIPAKKGYKVKVRWFNVVNPANVFDMRVGERGTENIFIKEADIAKWKIYEPAETKSIQL